MTHTFLKRSLFAFFLSFSIAAIAVSAKMVQDNHKINELNAQIAKTQARVDGVITQVQKMQADYAFIEQKVIAEKTSNNGFCKTQTCLKAATNLRKLRFVILAQEESIGADEVTLRMLTTQRDALLLAHADT